MRNNTNEKEQEDREMKKKALLYAVVISLSLVGVLSVLSMEKQDGNIDGCRFLVGFASLLMVYYLSDRFIWDKEDK